jgi:assimilatory nitrate reductase catalytic subunit
VEWQGFLLSRQRVAAPDVVWWAVSPGATVQRLEFAGTGSARPDAAWLRGVLPGAARAEWIEFEDAGTGNYRAALVENGRLLACLMVATRGELPARSWLTSLFDSQQLDRADRRSLLSGVRSDVPDPGATVCACFGVGVNTIRAAVQGGCATVDAVGKQLRAGTNCGSCRPEIGRIIGTCESAADAAASADLRMASRTAP